MLVAVGLYSMILDITLAGEPMSAAKCSRVWPFLSGCTAPSGYCSSSGVTCVSGSSCTSAR